MAKHAVDRIHRLIRRDMREPGRSDDIARGINPLHVTLIVVADLHVIAIELELHLRRKHAFDIRHHADRRQHGLRLDLLRLAVLHQGELHGILAHAEILALRRRPNRDALLFECAMQRFRDLFVLHRQDLRQHLHERNLGAEGIIKIGEFHSDRAGADDHDRLGQGFARQRFA